MRNHRHLAQIRLRAGILKEHRPPAGGHNDRFANQRDVARAHEVILPRHTVAAKLHPVRPKPSVALETNHLTHEIPFPLHLALCRQRKHSRSQRGHVHAPIACRWRGENRLAEIQPVDNLARAPLEHVIKTGRRADMQKLADDRRCGDVVAIPRATRSAKSPLHPRRGNVHRVHHARTIHHEHHPILHHRRRLNRIGQRHRRLKAEVDLQGHVGHIAGAKGIALQLRPVG